MGSELSSIHTDDGTVINSDVECQTIVRFVHVTWTLPSISNKSKFLESFTHQLMNYRVL